MGEIFEKNNIFSNNNKSLYLKLFIKLGFNWIIRKKNLSEAKMNLRGYRGHLKKKKLICHAY